MLTDLSQLTKAILKEPPPPRPVAKSAPERPQSREDEDAAEVLAYFSRTPQNAPQNIRQPKAAPKGALRAVPHVAPCTAPDKNRVAELKAALAAKDAALDALVEKTAEADARIAELESRLAAECEAHVAAVRERDRLQGECGRLQGELRRNAEKAPVAAPAQAVSVAPPVSPGSVRGILAAPGAVAEVFPGEVREHVVATLFDGLGTAERSGRDRRAEILRCVLAANESAGELERRRVELRQILKDAGYVNDPKPLERLGLRLISGRTHWKLQYANVRVTMSKTPSDYRANLNNGNEIANKCF